MGHGNYLGWFLILWILIELEGEVYKPFPRVLLPFALALWALRLLAFNLPTTAALTACALYLNLVCRANRIVSFSMWAEL